MKSPGMNVLHVNQGDRESMIGHDGQALPITIDGSRLGSAAAKVKVTGPHLYARATAAPYKARPFMQRAVISDPTNTTNATIDVPDADAKKFKVGDSVTYVNESTGAIHTESKVISAIGAAGSGGAGLTLVTLTGVWTTPPIANRLLVVADGTQLSRNAMVVTEDIEFDGSSDFLSHGFIKGTFQTGKVENTTYFVQDENQILTFKDMQ